MTFKLIIIHVNTSIIFVLESGGWSGLKLGSPRDVGGWAVAGCGAPVGL